MTSQENSRSSLLPGAVILLVLLLGGGLTQFAGAQAPTPLERASEFIEELDYAAARRALEAFIARPASATTTELAKAHLLLGIVEYSEGAEEPARRQFVSALQLQPEIQPDPSSVSPKIIAFFDDLRSSLTESSSTIETRYVTIVDDRPAAALRSMVLPGWGQLYKGHRGKAAVAGGAWFATAGATAVAHGLRRRARRRYVDETNPALVAERYDSFNKAHKARNTLAVSAAVVWVAAYIDALASPGRQVIAPASLAVAPTPDGVVVSARIRF